MTSQAKAARMVFGSRLVLGYSGWFLGGGLRRGVAGGFWEAACDGVWLVLNAIEPGTVMLVHRHRASSETVICIRGHFEEYFYDENGVLIETIDMRPGGAFVNVPAGQWHNLKSLESGTVLFECKDGAWAPLGEDEIMNVEGK